MAPTLENSARSSADAALPAGLAGWSLRRGRLCARFARNAADLERVLALRYDVFAREKGCVTHGGAGRESDEFDATAHHLLVLDERRDEVVGTYRLITEELAARGHGFYSAREFELEALPREVRAGGVELGRACVARERRGGPALSLLLAGVTQDLLHGRKRYFFGCASLPTLDPAVVEVALRALRRRGAVHEEIRLRARAGFRAPPLGSAHGPTIDALPALVERYLDLGAQVCSEPAYDREFRGADLLVVLDAGAVAPEVVDGYARGRR
jgi:putative hemolysin